MICSLEREYFFGVDTHHKIHVQLLEHVQSFAARMVTKTWDLSIDSEALKANLHVHWPSLASRQLVQKMILCHQIHKGLSLVPSSFFLLSSSQIATRSHNNSLPLLQPLVRTLQYRASFFIDVIPKWNSLQNSIISSYSTASFKTWIKKLFLT